MAEARGRDDMEAYERRIPQDGRIRATVASRKIDLRVSTLPCVGGEKTVMRILNEKSISVNLDDLGFDPDIVRAEAAKPFWRP